MIFIDIYLNIKKATKTNKYLPLLNAPLKPNKLFALKLYRETTESH